MIYRTLGKIVCDGCGHGVTNTKEDPDDLVCEMGWDIVLSPTGMARHYCMTCARKIAVETEDDEP